MITILILEKVSPTERRSWELTWQQGDLTDGPHGSRWSLRACQVERRASTRHKWRGDSATSWHTLRHVTGTAQKPELPADVLAIAKARLVAAITRR